jgi:GxxExxY protein
MRADLDPALDALTERIIGAAFTVSNSLGHGFLEAVYRNALCEELVSKNIGTEKERQFTIRYNGRPVGVYVADIVVEAKVVVELKAVENLARAHAAQVLNYLKASRLPVGLLFNFGTPRLQMKRIIL